MKRLIFLFLLFIPFVCHAQFFSLAGQYSEQKPQFVMNLSVPFYHFEQNLKKNILITSGVEFVADNKTSGINIKPISFNFSPSNGLKNDSHWTFLLGLDGGYMFNHHRSKNGVIFTPNVYVDYCGLFFLKVGSDLNVTQHTEQYFVRMGVCLGVGFSKVLKGIMR